MGITPTTVLGGTSRKLSRLNLAESLACSPADINQPLDPASPLLSLDADGNFAYQVVNINEIDISWKFTGKRLLFVLAVDVFPNEIVLPGAFTWSFMLPNGAVCNNSTAVMPCNPLIGLNGKTVAVPAPCGSPFQLRFGSPIDDPAPGYPKRKKVPVFVSSNAPTTFNIDKLDFLLKLQAVQAMAGISLLPGVLSASDVTLYKEQPGNSSMDQRIYVKTGNFSLSTTNTNTPGVANTLFSILIDGPELESDCGTVKMEFTNYRRMFLSGTPGCCQPLIGSSSSNVQWAPVPCPGLCSQTTVSVAQAVNNLPAMPPLDACTDLLFDVIIEAASAIEFDAATFSVSIIHSGSLAWNNSLSSSPYCADMTGCVTTTIVAPNIIRLDFTIDGGNTVNLTGGAGNSLARLGFRSSAGDACIEGVTFQDVVLHQLNASNACLPLTSTAIHPNVGTSGVDDDICTNSLVMKYQRYDGEAMQEVTYETLDATNVACKVGIASGIGSQSICACNKPNETQTLRPSKNDNPLNGVTTYDLVLISKHVLGIEALGASNSAYGPFRIIAADANKSNSVTTSDIVELRKLILGIYQTLPNNNSWRFVDKTFSFPNPYNPFQTAFPESAPFILPPLGVVREFYGIKVGDVNETAVVPRPGEEQTQKVLGFGTIGGTVGATVEVPVFAREGMSALAWQASFHYDPSKAKLLGLRWAETPGEFQEQAWHEPSPGVVNALWYDGTGAEKTIPNGTPLFFLKFELLTSASSVEISLSRDAEYNLAYTSGGTSSILALDQAPLDEYNKTAPVAATPVDQLWKAAIYPNPSSGQFRFEVTLPEASQASVTILDPLGRQVWQYSALLNSGYNSIGSNQMPILSSGQYFVRFETAFGRKTVRFVKL